MLLHSLQVISGEANGCDDVVVDMGDDDVVDMGDDDELRYPINSTALSVSLRR